MRVSLVLSLCFGLTTVGCAGTPEEAELRIKLIDAQTKQPLARGLVSLEDGGLYLRNPDTSKGSPAYQHGFRASDQGTMTFNLPTEINYGIHSFVDGYYYGSKLIDRFDQDTGVTVNMEPFQSGVVAPSIKNARLDPKTVAVGGSFKIIADVTAAEASDPLSDEVIVVYPHAWESRALAPPSAGVQGKGYPDGTWSAELSAPDQPGTYTYYLAATSEHCITSDTVTLKLEVQ